MTSRRTKVAIGPVALDLRVGDAGPPLRDPMPAFVTRSSGRSRTTIRLRIRAERVPIDSIRLPRPVFDTGARWSLHRRPDGWIYRIVRSRTAGETEALAYVDEPHDFAEVLLAPDAPDPVPSPLDELLVAVRGARSGVLIVHGASVASSGRGVLLAGPSGAGKSTFARLWTKRGELLSDERSLVSFDGSGRPWVHGTPWWGSARIGRPGSARLSAILRLERGRRSSVVPMEPAEAFRALAGCVFVPRWNAGAVGPATGTLARLCENVPCFRFPFVPDASARREVRRILRSGL